jgi:hypothetical protein
MASGRYKRARESTKPSAHKVREFTLTTIGALIVAILAYVFANNRLFILFGGVIGAVFGFILSIYWPRFVAVIQDPRIQLEARITTLESQLPLAAEPSQPLPPALVISSIVRESKARFSEKFEEPTWVVPGVIYTEIAVNVSARPDTPYPITVVRYEASIQVDNGDPQELETAKYKWFGDKNTESELIIIQPGGTLSLVLSFAFKPKTRSGKREIYIPKTVQALKFSVVDSLNNHYELRQTIDLILENVSDPF